MGLRPRLTLGSISPTLTSMTATPPSRVVTTSMLPHGIPFPVLPQSTEIMNIIVPNMMQNVLTRKMTVDQATDDAAKKIKELLADL